MNSTKFNTQNNNNLTHDSAILKIDTPNSPSKINKNKNLIEYKRRHLVS